MNRYRLATTLFITAVLILCAICPRTADSAPITYSFTGSGTGTLGASPFTNAAFSVNINADTNNVAFQPSIGSFGILNLIATINISGLGAATFTLPLFVFGGSTIDTVGFGNFSEGNLMALEVGSPGYNLVSNFGPISGPNLFLDQFFDVGTNRGLLTYSAMSDVVFTARLTSTAIPEPYCFTLAAIGLLTLIGKRFGKTLVGRRA